jgi:adenosylmethionine-8-amino-7-oxononanoate aminotransferase
MFIAEPVGGTSSPGVAAPREYYARVRDICDKHDVLFVADEILCGYGRCGRPFAIADWNVTPDIITLGKAMASGYAPLAAMVVSEKIRDGLAGGTGRFVHGLTYSGTPSSCFIGLKVHEIMLREGLFTRAGKIGGVQKAGLDRLAARHPIIGEVRGRGLLFGLELVADRARRMPFDRSLGVARQVAEGMRKRGIVIAQGTSTRGDQVQISPPFTISEGEVGVIVASLDETLLEVSRATGENLA